MSKIILCVFVLAAGMSGQDIYADDAVNSALQKTQDCLRDQNCDAAATDAGKEADQKAWAAMGGNAHDKQELYNISADIMPILVRQAGGDPVKMQNLMLKAQTDPESFLNSLSPDLKEKIKNIANALDKNQASGQRP